MISITLDAESVSSVYATDMSIVTKRVGTRIADLRRTRHRTQEELASGAAINRVTLARIETGANVSLELLARIARALGVTLVDLVR